MAAADELAGILDELDRFPRAAVELVNGALVDELDRQVRADTGGDYVLSGAARRGHKRTKLKVTSKVTSSIAGATGIVSAGPRKARAQWAWLDVGTGEPGPTPAKGTFSDPAARVLPRVERQIADRFQIAITR